MCQNTENLDVDLEEQINNHPILALDKNARVDSELLVSFYEMMMKHFRLDSSANNEIKQSIKEAGEEDEERKTANSSKTYSNYSSRHNTRNRYAQEPVVFFDTILQTLKAYEKKQGKYLHYFRASHLRNYLRDSAELNAADTGRMVVSREDLRTLGEFEEILNKIANDDHEIFRDIDNLVKKLDVNLFALDEEEIRIVSEAFGWTPNKMKKAIKLRDVVGRKMLIHASETTNSDELDGSYDMDHIFGEDRTALDEYTRIENREEIVDVIYAITVFLDEDDREYPRYFLTNALLYPLKKEPHDDEYDVSKKVMTQTEELLFAHVFIKDYLSFLICSDVELNSIVAIDNGRVNEPTVTIEDFGPRSNIAIAKFTQTTSANVSQRRSAWYDMLAIIMDAEN